MITQICLLVLIQLNISLSQIANGWEKFPLRDVEIKLIKKDSESRNVIPLTNNQNQSCVLTPSNPDSSRTCTWRTRRQCKKVPRVRKVPVFSPWCTNQGEAGFLGRCHETSQQRPLVHSVTVCTPTGVPDCRGPCYQCKEYCETVQQSVCETSHSISTVVTEKQECDYNNDQGKCNQIVKRIEKDVVTTNENCYQKDAQMCGPANCKFMNVTMECVEKETSVMADLRRRECTVCQPTLSETVETLDICDDVLTDDCQDDPLLRPWSKFCDTDKSQVVNNGITFTFDESPRSIPVQDLLKKSLNPITDLLNAAEQVYSSDSKKFTTTTTIVTSTPKITTTKRTTTPKIETTRTTTSLPKIENNNDEDVSGILELLSLDSRNLRNNISREPKLKVHFTTTGRNSPATSSIYFDPILNTRPLNSQADNRNAQQSFTEFLNQQLQEQVSSTRKSTTNVATTTFTATPVKKISATSTTTARSTTTTTTTSSPTSTSTTTSTTTTTTTTTTSTTTTSTTTSSSPTSKTRTTLPANSKRKMKLSPADFLRLCFISQIGCDFSENEVLESTRESLATTTTTTEATTTTSTQEPQHLTSEQEEKIRKMIRDCFFNGDCGIGKSDSSSRIDVVTTPAPSATSSTVSSRDEDIKNLVKLKAHKCFFEGICK